MGNFCILKTIIVLIWREFGTKILFSINQSIRVALKAELLQGYDKMSKSDDDVRTWLSEKPSFQELTKLGLRWSQVGIKQKPAQKHEEAVVPLLRNDAIFASSLLVYGSKQNLSITLLHDYNYIQ